ncbi:HNH endonuclease family protein [Actinomadura sp. K4S16]|uniref:HNH endonuclease family protein n=1 Tax=Actinomadura sp. K4S16 TaxID=1316147 RepID=UPI001F2FDB06|nr:HNH endonuclease family protein [Actinomadura sp. K4S16]
MTQAPVLTKASWTRAMLAKARLTKARPTEAELTKAEPTEAARTSAERMSAGRTRTERTRTGHTRTGRARTGRTRTARAAVAGLALAVPLAAAGCEGDVGLSETGSPSSGTTKPASGDAAKARKNLSGLRIASTGDSGGYRRDKFGTRWKDTDHNGCDQRNDVLARDLEKVEKKGRCIVLSGRLDDPYSGKQITFEKKDAAEVQIDHVYPLALAWRMGASRWSEDKREQFANDHDNLLAVWGVPNRQKSDSGPGEWKPQKGFQCVYAIKYIAVAKEYELPVTRSDHDALQDFLGRC